jgi:hypothetical protein
VLEQESAGAGAQRPEHVIVGVERGQDDDLRRVPAGAQQLGGRQPVHPGHPDVHQHHVGPVLVHRAHDLGAVGDLRHDGDVGGSREHQ